MKLAVALVLAALAAAVALLALTPVFDRLRRRALRRIVREVAEVFSAHGVRYWCDFGTLLGLYRENDIILGDKDADICILETEAHRLPALEERLAERDLSLLVLKRAGGELIRIRDRRTPYHMDVYAFREDGAMLRSLLHPTEDLPLRLVERCAPRPFLGTTLRAPEDVPALLRHRYGADFLVPRRNDKGATRPFSRLRSLAEDLEHGCLGLWSLLRFRRGGAGPSGRGA